ncbi:hypothetical protein LFZ31_15570, partial [Salmonella enterica subsp. enterica serovar Newport str. S09097]
LRYSSVTLAASGPVAIGHPCYGCNEEGIGFHKGIHQLAHVENQTPRSEKPDVNMKEGGNISAGAVGLLGGVVGLVARRQRDGGT